LNVDLKRETVEELSKLKEITGKEEDEIVTTAVTTFIQKNVLPIASLASILGFGIFHHVFLLANL